MAGYIDAEAAQLLNQPPDLGTIGGNFLSDLGAADDDRGVLHQQAHDAAEAEVGGLRLMCGGRRGPWVSPNCACVGDAVIMRDVE